VEPCCFDQNIAVQVVEMPSKALCFRRHGSNVTQTAVVTCEQCSGRDGRWMVEEAGGVLDTLPTAEAGGFPLIGGAHRNGVWGEKPTASVVGAVKNTIVWCPGA
jgi:hypothetical protein